MPIRNLLAALLLVASGAQAAPAGHEPDRYTAARDYIRSRLVAEGVPAAEHGSASAEKPFAPSAALTGKWVGHISIPEGDLPVTLVLRPDGFVSDLTDQRFTAGLTYWIDLSREQDRPQP